MNFKIICLLSCMVFCTKALESVKLVRELVESQGPSFDGSADSYVNLIVEVNVNSDASKTSSKMMLTLDTTTENIWVASEDCTLHCPSIPENPLKSNQGKKTSIDNDNVKGWIDNYNIDIGTIITTTNPIVNAYSVSRSSAQRIASSSNGILGLNAIIDSSPEGIISICTSGPNIGLYKGIPQSLVKQDVKENARSYITSLSSTEWRIKIDYIRNSWGEWKSWCVGGCSALIDSTFNGISGPEYEINSINKFLGADNQGNIPCYKAKELQSIYFFIGSYRYKLDAKNYIIKSNDRFNHQCKSAFVVENGYNNQWRLGVPLLDQYLTVIDYNSKNIAFMAMK